MDYNFLSKTVLFRGASPEEIQSMLSCLSAETKQYQRGNIIYHAGDSISSLGLVLSGRLSIEYDDVRATKAFWTMLRPDRCLLKLMHGFLESLCWSMSLLWMHPKSCF